MRSLRSNPRGPGDRNPEPWRPLHVLGMDLEPMNGYVARTVGLVTAQALAGEEPRVLTPPFYPRGDGSFPQTPRRFRDLEVPVVRVEHPVDVDDRSRLPLSERSLARLHDLRRRGPFWGGTVNGQSRTGQASRWPYGGPLARLFADPFLRMQERILLDRLERELVATVGATIIGKPQPRILHAHSPYRSGLPAIAVGRCLSLPVVYEVRGLWDESAVAAGLFSRGSRCHRAWRRQEAQVLAQADAVVVLGAALGREVVERGAKPERVFVVPNAAPDDWLETEAAGDASDDRTGSGCTLGYIGSLRQLEGVEDLVRATARLVDEGADVSLLVVGDGPRLPALRTLARDLGLGDRATFPGAIPHAAIRPWYRRLDVLVISRPDLPVTRWVTPLKPLEAMAQGVPVVASRLPALEELVGEDERGLLYPPGDLESLAEQCRRLAHQPELRARLGRAARRWVAGERTWSRSASALRGAYAAAEANCRDQRGERR